MSFGKKKLKLVLWREESISLSDLHKLMEHLLVQVFVNMSETWADHHEICIFHFNIKTCNNTRKVDVKYEDPDMLSHIVYGK